MAIEEGRIGLLAAEVMELAAGIELEDGEEISIGTVAVVVELEIAQGEGPGATHVFYRCSDSRRWVQAGFFRQALRAVWAPDVEEEEEER